MTATVLASTASTAGCGSSSSFGGAGGAGGTAGSGGGSASADAGGGGGSAVTGLSGTRALNTLTATEATQLCDDTYAYFGTAIPRATECRWKGLSYAASSSAPSQAVLQQNCTNQENACLQADGGVISNPGCGDIATTCTATVADYSACITDEVAAFDQTVNGLPACSALTTAGTSAIFDAQTGGTPPASCTSLSNACPTVYPPSPLTN
jgi:hypothetical protein